MTPYLADAFPGRNVQVCVIIQSKEVQTYTIVFSYTDPCALVDCKPGFRCKVNKTTNEAFCAQPELSCAEVSCLKPDCEEGEVIETPPGECCPVCTRPDCAAVLCLALTDQDCDDGEVLVTPPGECCARCQRDCSAVSCVRPVCEKGEMLEVPEGKCCLICVKEGTLFVMYLSNTVL